jgi:hypothetical protein
MLLSDFGEARSGPGPHAGDIMPIQYRAPEVIMCLKWSYAVDIWSVGLTVCVLHAALSNIYLLLTFLSVRRGIFWDQRIFSLQKMKMGRCTMLRTLPNSSLR